jgi:hypothetical protein
MSTDTDKKWGFCSRALRSTSAGLLLLVAPAGPSCRTAAAAVQAGRRIGDRNIPAHHAASYHANRTNVVIIMLLRVDVCSSRLLSLFDACISQNLSQLPQLSAVHALLKQYRCTTCVLTTFPPVVDEF